MGDLLANPKDNMRDKNLRHQRTLKTFTPSVTSSNKLLDKHAWSHQRPIYPIYQVQILTKLQNVLKARKESEETKQIIRKGLI